MISLRSEVTRKLLSLFYLNPHETLYVNELSRRLGLDKRNLVKKLHELDRIGILKSERRGNLRLYRVNPEFPLYQEYKKIVLKTIGIEEKLKQIMRDTPGVQGAHIYGSYARDAMSAHSDLDLLVVGNHDIKTLQKKISLLQREINREINSVNMSEAEYRKRAEMKDPFLSGIFQQKTIRLV
ncbi:MAG: nucleotidyltransferase domain-containing protein [Candidatus Aminicenantales bacterium]